jgi:DNA-binding MarR family transcriptional regulator
VWYTYAMPSGDPLTAEELAQELGRHARLLHMLRSQMTSSAPSGMDGAAFGVLMGLVKCGPSRQGELAERSMLDPSTVSRYVAQLVKTGLIDRRPDPADGRAVQLVASEQGQALAAQAMARRRLLIGDMLESWSDEDARQLVRLLRRLNDEMDARRFTHTDTTPVAGGHA